MTYHVGDEIIVEKGHLAPIEVYRWLENNDAHLDVKSETETAIIYIIASDAEEIRNHRRVGRLKEMLADTDYQAIKHSEGELTDEEYAPIREQRRQWRAEINQLEAKIESLK